MSLLILLLLTSLVPLLLIAEMAADGGRTPAPRPGRTSGQEAGGGRNLGHTQGPHP